MKGLILSGGKGLRMRPFSLYTTKQLLPVLNKPVLFHNIDLLLSAGITDIGIVVGPMKKNVLEEINNSDYLKKVKFTFIEQLEPLGLAHAVMKSRSFLGDQNFVMVLGDNFFSMDLQAAISYFAENNAQALVALTEVSEPRRYGIAVTENEKVILVQEKPESPLSNLALAGLYIFKSSIHQTIAGLQPSSRNELEITDAIQKQIDCGEIVKPWLLDGYWCDIGTLKDLLGTNIKLLENYKDFTNEKELHSRTILSVIKPPVLIHKTAVVLDSIVGPNVVIGRNAIVINSFIQNSVVIENSKVEQVAGKNMIFSPWGSVEVLLND